MESQELQLSERTAGPRFTELDSLRGLAACTVILHHYFLAFGFRSSWKVMPLIAGRQAVMLFFVLSGFVLSLPFWAKGTYDSYQRYLVRRCFRIYVPYVVALALSMVGSFEFGQRYLPLSSWFQGTWHSPLTLQLIWQHLTMRGLNQLNTAFWSLRYEVEMSIIFPVLLLGLRAFSVRTVLIVSAALAYVCGTSHLMLNEYAHLLKFGAMFAAGAVMARRLPETRVLWSRTPKALRVMLLLVSVFCYVGYGDLLCLKLHKPQPEDFLPFLGACGLIVCSMHLRALRRLLRLPLPEYLGRVSYSVYLVHGTVLFASFYLLYGKTPPLVLEVVFLVVTFALSHLFCRAVEEPALRLGKALSIRTR